MINPAADRFDTRERIEKYLSIGPSNDSGIADGYDPSVIPVTY
jgi:hypothetical protein